MLRVVLVLVSFLFASTADAADVTLKTSDGVRVHADYKAGKGTTGVQNNDRHRIEVKLACLVERGIGDCTCGFDS